MERESAYSRGEMKLPCVSLVNYHDYHWLSRKHLRINVGIILCRDDDDDDDDNPSEGIWCAEMRTRCLARGNSTCWSCLLMPDTREHEEKFNIPQNFIAPFPFALPYTAALKHHVVWNDSFTSSTSASRHFLSPPLARKQERRINSFVRTEMRTQLYPAIQTPLKFKLRIS